MCHAKEKVYTPTDTQPNTIYCKTCILVHGSRNGILLPVCVLYPVCQWYECSGLVFWSLVPLMMVCNNIKICRIINTVTIVNWECNYMACNWMLVVKYMGDINQFKTFLCLQIHVLYHPMSKFAGKKTLNLWWVFHKSTLGYQLCKVIKEQTNQHLKTNQSLSFLMIRMEMFFETCCLAV